MKSGRTSSVIFVSYVAVTMVLAGGCAAPGETLEVPGLLPIARVSVDGSGIQGDNNSFNPSISADGRYVAFDSYATNLVLGDTNGAQDVFVAPAHK